MLFETMERLLDSDDTTMDLERAETISKVGQTIINSAKVEVDFIKHTGAGGSSFLQGGLQPAGNSPRLAAVPERPAIEVTAETPHEDLCLNCVLPECDESSAQCLVQIQKRAA